MAAAAARPPTMVIQDDYIDMDLTPTSTPLPPASPRFEFQSSGARRSGEEAFASPADELFYKGNLLPLHLPPRLQLVQRLLQDSQNAAAEEVGDGKVVAKKPSWSRRLKVVKRWASRDYIRSLFLATTRPSGIVVDGNGTVSVSARAPDEEVCHHRKSFSGIIRRVRLVATKTAAPTPAPGVSPSCSSFSSSSSSSSTPSCGNANGFFFRPPVLKRSSSAGSEEGAIQGAIAHCKRSQQLHGMGTMASRRSSASDVVFYSVTNTPRASSVEVAQEMCRG